MSPNRAEDRPQKLVFPPTAQQRGQVQTVPGAVVNLISRSQTPGTHSLSMKPMDSERFAGSPETAELHLPGLAMIAKILCGIEPAPRVDTANFEASFTERLDGYASARAASNHNDVKNLFWHCGSPFGRRQMLVFEVIGMRAGWRVRIELQCWIVDFLVANFGGVKAYD